MAIGETRIYFFCGDSAMPAIAFSVCAPGLAGLSFNRNKVMEFSVETKQSPLAAAIFGILNPIPYGAFAAALLFDIIYFQSGEILWDKGAAWLNAFGLVAAVVPRLINFTHVWITAYAFVTRAAQIDFWLNLLAVFLAIVNAFVHSRDAYASMPDGVWLSALTVLILSISHAAVAVRAARRAYRYA